MNGCRIKLVSREKFYQLQQNHHLNSVEDNSIFPWKAKNILRLREKGYTDKVVNCNAGGISNGKRVTIFHLDSDETRAQSEKRAIGDILTRDVFELSNEGVVRGFICGGRAYHIQDDEDSDTEGAGINSERLHQMLEQSLLEAGLDDITQIWGRRKQALDGNTNILYNPKKNTWYLNAQIDADDEIGTDILTLEGLREAYITVHLAKGDVLKTPEGTYTYRDVNNNYTPLGKLRNAITTMWRQVKILWHSYAHQNGRRIFQAMDKLGQRYQFKPVMEIVRWNSSFERYQLWASVTSNYKIPYNRDEIASWVPSRFDS